MKALQALQLFGGCRSLITLFSLILASLVLFELWQLPLLALLAQQPLPLPCESSLTPLCIAEQQQPFLPSYEPVHQQPVVASLSLPSCVVQQSRERP